MLALDAAGQGIVLLKNDNDFLPLDKNQVNSLAIIGSAANDPNKLGGGYTGIPCNPTTLFDGHRAYIQKLLSAEGCLNVSYLTQEREDHDRVRPLLPGKQMEVIATVLKVTKKPLVLVLMGGRPLDISFVKDDPRVASILWVGYPGEAGGQAVADIIFGKFNQGGRLTVTWYPESFTRIPMDDMHM